jgi:hypothetical protein
VKVVGLELEAAAALDEQDPVARGGAEAVPGGLRQGDLP